MAKLIRQNPAHAIPDGRGIIQYDAFVTIFTVINRLFVRFTIEKDKKHKEGRRKILRDKKENEYQVQCQYHLDYKTKVKNYIVSQVLKCYKIGP